MIIYWGSLVCDESLLSCCFQGSFFVFWRLDCNVSWCDSLLSSFYLEFVKFLWCLYLCLSSNWKCFSHYFFKYSLCPIFSFFGDSYRAYVGLLNYVPRCLKLCSIFYNFFSFCYSLFIIYIVQSLGHWFFLWPVPICFWIFFFFLYWIFFF